MQKAHRSSIKGTFVFKPLYFIFLAALVFCMSATAVDDMSQKMEVNAELLSGVSIDGANCELRNDKGNWSVVTPNSVDVYPSTLPLQVSCSKDGYSLAIASVDRQADGRVLGSLGAFGRLVVGGSSTARPTFMSNDNTTPNYQYPSPINIVMTPLPVEVSLPNSSPRGDFRQSNKAIDFDEAKKKCDEIGFRKGTENFGMCVLKLMSK